MNTFYSAFQVLKKYIEDNDMVITNYTPQPFYSRCVMWVSENAGGYSHFVCEKKSPTQFTIYGFNGQYEQILFTGYDFADVNTPEQLLTAQKEPEPEPEPEPEG